MFSVVDCPNCGMAFGAGGGGGAGGGFAANLSPAVSSQGLKEIEHVRTMFPETGLWENSTTGYKSIIFFENSIAVIILVLLVESSTPRQYIVDKY